MARHYSFLVRRRQLADGEEWLDIEHIGSGERTLVASIAATVNWIEERAGEPGGQTPGRGGGTARDRPRKSPTGRQAPPEGARTGIAPETESATRGQPSPGCR